MEISPKAKGLDRRAERRVRHNSQSTSSTVRSPLHCCYLFNTLGLQTPRPRRFQQSGKGRPRVGRAREKRAEHGKRHRGRSSSSGRISERGFPFLIFTRLKSVRQMDRRKGRTDPRHRRTTDSISAPQSCDRPDCEARSRVRLCCGYFAIDACCEGSLARRSGVTIDLH